MPVLDMTLARDGKVCFWTSSVGRKLLMALTGFAMIGFVTVHMIGNLTAWMGATAMNGYAHFLQTMAHEKGIWVFRSGLLAILLVHLWAATSLTLDNWAARPKGYRKQKLQATWASRSMRYTAFFLAAFVVYHLLHLTVGSVHPEFVHGKAFENFVHGFKDPVASSVYIIANFCLGLHIWHGVWSFSQTLGLAHPRYDACRRHLATLWAMAVTGVNILYPVAVMCDWIRL